ncbi:hypothetical protein [Ruegeria arenilitoris]|uniref:hypothetical protein n=1 Tax=Ruegeria arenilitoris TaxID=1173585 RepID=UPI00147F5997|nr:hypothetical protein [Ruegeria arenilitoris]
MEYKLNEVRPGTFEVVRSMPVVMGTFTDPEIAEKFMSFLALEDEDAQRDLTIANADEKPTVAELAAPVAAPVRELKVDAVSFEQEPKVHRPPYTPATKFNENAGTPLEISDEPWTEDELASAFKMLSKGETLKIVATRHGKCWKKLRSKWAFHKKTLIQQDAAPTAAALVPVSEPAKTPLEKVTAVVEQLKAQEECKICKRHFTPTLENLDLCARCSHGA